MQCRGCTPAITDKEYARPLLHRCAHGQVVDQEIRSEVSELSCIGTKIAWSSLIESRAVLPPSPELRQRPDMAVGELGVVFGVVRRPGPVHSGEQNRRNPSRCPVPERPLLSPWWFLLDERLRRQFGAASKQPQPIAKLRLLPPALRSTETVSPTNSPPAARRPVRAIANITESLAGRRYSRSGKAPGGERQTEAEGTIANPRRVALVGMSRIRRVSCPIGRLMADAFVGWRLANGSSADES